MEGNKAVQRNPELIVMLTYNDLTVENAFEIFDGCKNSRAEFFGAKEKSLPFEKMKKLYSCMQSSGKKTVLEVVSYSEKEGLDGAKMAADLGAEILMGTFFFDSIKDFCMKNGLKYMPFVGNVRGRPSVLDGEIDSIISEAQSYIEKGAWGIDLLGYRYTGNPYELNKKFVEKIDAPVCIAGSVDSYQRLSEIKKINPWAFTIGSAFFEKKFGESFSEQINKVDKYISSF